MSNFCHIESPLGRLMLTANDKALTGLYMLPSRKSGSTDGWIEGTTARPLAVAIRQIAEYFAGERQKFELPLALDGTPFQTRVWRELMEIPFGRTWSYAELARRIGKPGASRAVGLANGSNPISIIVPCHRVIGSDGSLTGYGGGLERKRWLLEHEGSAGRQQSLALTPSSRTAA
jgi:methylated-DNA-[protein]-cysteine S-methyltransferase